MFSLEIYKTLRSGYWVLIPGLLVFSLVWIFGFGANKERLMYNPLQAQNDLYWAKIGEIYESLFLSFVVLPIVIALHNLIIFQDKNARLLKSFEVFGLSKIRYWTNKFVYVQSLTLLICVLLVGIPLLFQLGEGSLRDFHWIQLGTGFVVGLKIWLTMWATTIFVFIFCIVFPQLHQSLLAGFGLIIWTMVLPFSPVAFVQQGAIQFQDLSLNKIPMQWSVDHFKWEIGSVVVSLISGIILTVVIYQFRSRPFFRRFFFNSCLAALTLSFVACKNDSIGIDHPRGKSADILLLEWIDTVGVMDQQGSFYKLTTMISDFEDSLIYLDFWNSHCIPCMKAFPDIDGISDLYDGGQLQVLYLNTDEDPDRWFRALNFTNTRGHPNHFRVGYPDYQTIYRIGLQIYPRYVLLDQKRDVIDFYAPILNMGYVDSVLGR